MTSERAKDVFLMCLLVLSMTGCATLIALDPVQTPPPQFRGDVATRIEFVAPERVSIRCIERGVPFLANACSDQTLITAPNPCSFAEPYARIMCHEMGHTNGWDTAHRDIRPASESPAAKALN